MSKRVERDPAEYIVPLNMNHLQGRMLHLPSPKGRSREILLVYGHHALLERWSGLAETLNAYGAVTMPDLPGFGGMDSFHAIGKKPTIDNYADYLAAFIKLQYKRRRLTIVGVSFGFVVVTRMLQRYPELAKRVDFVVAIVGFMHKDDFLFKTWEHRAARITARLLATRPMVWTVRYAFLNHFVIGKFYTHYGRAKHRIAKLNAEQTAALIDFDVHVWRANDVRTHWMTTAEYLALDNCKQHVPLPIWHVRSSYDHYFDNHIVEQHMQVVFREYHQTTVHLESHTPSLLADKKALSVLVPPSIRRALLRT